MAENEIKEPSGALAEQIKNILAQTQPDIINSIRARLQEQVTDSLGWSLRSYVDDVIKNFMQSDEIKAEITTMLEDAKPEILAELRKAIVLVAAIIGERMHEKAVENLATGYKVSKLIETIF
jgi:hypothetical protein